jgi:EF hand
MCVAQAVIPERPMKKLVAIGALALIGLAPAPLAIAKPAAPLAALDADKSGNVDSTEINKSAEALFDKLDKDKDGTLEPKELQGRLSKKAFKAADADNDGTLTRDEFLSATGNLFKSADPDNDGTLDARELASKQGKALLRLTH